MPNLDLPSAEYQLQFLKKIQRILQTGSFSSTYKFALLMSLSRLCIEKGENTGDQLTLEYNDIAEQFIDLYWKQSCPFEFKQDHHFTLYQNNGTQAKIVDLIQRAQQNYIFIGRARSDQLFWRSLIKDVAKIIKTMPMQYLQNIKEKNNDFLYSVQSSNKNITLYPKVMYCFRQFNEIIGELCEKKWIDFIRTTKRNNEILQGYPDLEKFMFEPSRSQLKEVALFLRELQQGKCFFCEKHIQSEKGHVDHFIPWSRYSVDTGHNFVLVHERCNLAKSNLLAEHDLLEKWKERNKIHNVLITKTLSELGFLTDLEGSHSIADWAYEQARINHHIFWKPLKI